MKSNLRIILILLIVLLAAAFIYLLVGKEPANIHFDVATLTGNDQIGVYGPVGIQFDRPMNHASVEEHISFSPKTSGSFMWVGDTVWFYPDEPIDPAQNLTFLLRPGAKSASDESLNVRMEWNLSIRSTQILYLVLDQTGGDLWRWDFTTESSVSLTDTGGSVIDFAANRIGEAIVYAAENTEGGSDLWVTDRDGALSTLIVDCGLDYCSQPVWSADSVSIAYARQNFNATTGLLQSPQIWLYDRETGESAPLYAEENVPGELPSYSPNGEWLAFYDIGEDGIRVLNLATSEETLIPTDVEAMGDWSPDGSRLLFTEQVPSALEPEIALYEADLDNKTVTRVLADDSDGTFFSQPRYSPDGEWIAVSLRPVNSTGNKALWVLKLDGSEINLITNQQNANYTSYHWSPSGLRLIYQRLDTGSSAFQSSIWMWSWSSDESQMLIENGSRPVWLP
ncbi:MAG: hypothetical protein H0S82_02800 [Anaerolineaceae bacterium]|nr:hypothetical protein [Anaerolineaceae bacterium]